MPKPLPIVTRVTSAQPAHAVPSTDHLADTVCAFQLARPNSAATPRQAPTSVSFIVADR